MPDEPNPGTGDGDTGLICRLTELTRAIVRPILTLTGWAALLYLVVILVLKFADKDLVTVMVSLFTGSLTTFIGFWFAERSRREE